MSDAAAVSFGSVKGKRAGRRKRQRSNEADAQQVRKCLVEGVLSGIPLSASTQKDDTKVHLGGAANASKRPASLNSFSVRKRCALCALVIPSVRLALQTGESTQAGSAAKQADLFGAIESSGTAELQKRNLATAERLIDTSADRDATAEYERRMKEADEGTGDGTLDLTKRSKEIMGRKKAFGTLGPIRAPTNVRASNVIDYQPDICKDYFETGYCGWGDSCKFLHMREKFTAGWKQEADWQALQQKREAALASGLKVDADGRIIQGEGAGASESKPEEAELPFACFICRVPWEEKWEQVRSAPVVTQCGHYVCEQCALRRYKRDPTCAACGKETYGIFNRGDRVIQRMAENDKGPDAPSEKAAAAAATAGGGWGAEVVVSK